MSTFGKLLGENQKTLSNIGEAYNWIVADGNRTSTWWDPKSSDTAYTTNRVLEPEEEPKAPKQLPFHMELAQTELENTINKASETLSIYVNSYKNGLFTKEERKALQEEIHRLKLIIKALDKTRSNLSKFVLGF